MADLKGRAFERLASGGIGRTIPGVTLTFIRERTNERHRTETDERGTYRIDLEPARYRVQAKHPDYEIYTSDPGFLVLRDGGSIANVFLKRSVTVDEPETSVFRGKIYERLSDGSIGDAISETVLSFMMEGTSEVHTVTAESDGTYAIELPLGRYVVTAAKEGYEPYSSEPGFFVLRPEPTIANIFMEPAAPAMEPNRFVFRGDRQYHQRSVL